MVELLAPAGSREALVAAVENGANAIYLAGNAFGARAYASNFDREALREAIHFAHLRHVAIHVTVNTIVAEDVYKRQVSSWSKSSSSVNWSRSRLLTRASLSRCATASWRAASACARSS